MLLINWDVRLVVHRHVVAAVVTRDMVGDLQAFDRRLEKLDRWTARAQDRDTVKLNPFRTYANGADALEQCALVDCGLELRWQVIDLTHE